MTRREPKPHQAPYARLPPGTHGIAPEQVRLHQRDRLHQATITTVAQNGYQKTTIAAVVDLAGVSRTTFYEHFESKQDCFLQTYDLIVTHVIEQVREAYRSASGPRERLRAAFAVFTAIVTAETESARLAMIEALAAGDVALEHRERTVQAFEKLLRQSFAQSPGEVTDVTLRAIIGGVLRIVYVRLREGRAQELAELVDELVDWTLSYQAAAIKPPAAPRPRRKASPSAPRLEVPYPDPARARLTHSQRERILLAVSTLVAEHGYRALTIPAITARAGVSNQTFYEHFKGKENAFLAAFDDAATDALRTIAATFEATPTLPDAVREAVRAVLSYTASHPAFARLAFIESLTPGTAAQEHAERTLQGFIDLVSPGSNRPPAVPSIAEEAIAGGMVSVIRREISNDRIGQLERLTACMAYVVLTPFLGAAAASRIAQRQRR